MQVKLNYDDDYDDEEEEADDTHDNDTQKITIITTFVRFSSR